MRILDITSLDTPGLGPYRTLRQPVEHFREGIFVAEGEKVVRLLLANNLEVLSLLLTPEWFEIYQKEIESHPAAKVFRAHKSVVEEIVGFHLHQGIMAVGKIPLLPTLDSLLKTLASPYFFAAVDGLTNAENLGIIVRNCAAFGVQGLIVGETSSSPYLRRAVRNSMGSIFQLPVVHVSALAGTLLTLKNDHHIHTIAAHPHTERHTPRDAPFTESCCIVLGSEAEGISPEVLASCSMHTAIPMANNIDSLNVANASAVFFYEVQRQRSLSPSHK